MPSDIQAMSKNFPLSRSLTMLSSGIYHLEPVNATLDDKRHGSLKNMEPKPMIDVLTRVTQRWGGGGG